MDKQQLEQQIEQFIHNEMTPAEQQAFCQMMEADKNLKQQVQLRMLLMEGELIRAEKKARAAMEMEAPAHASVRPWLAAACILFILAGIGFYIGNSYRYAPSEIYRTCYEAPIIERTRGEGLTGQAAVYNQQIITAYEERQYASIVALYQQENLSALIDNFPASTRLYISIAFVEQQKAPEAIPLLLPLTATPYQDEAEWMLLCCYLQLDKRDKAVKLIEKIKENNGLYTDKALLIEKRLKEKRWF